MREREPFAVSPPGASLGQHASISDGPGVAARPRAAPQSRRLGAGGGNAEAPASAVQSRGREIVDGAPSPAPRCRPRHLDLQDAIGAVGTDQRHTSTLRPGPERLQRVEACCLRRSEITCDPAGERRPVARQACRLAAGSAMYDGGAASAPRIGSPRGPCRTIALGWSLASAPERRRAWSSIGGGGIAGSSRAGLAPPPDPRAPPGRGGNPRRARQRGRRAVGRNPAREPGSKERDLSRVPAA